MNWLLHYKLDVPKLSILLTAGSALVVFGAGSAFAGGPKFVAGVSFFNPAVQGQAVHWGNGQLNYFVDQGPLNGSINNAQATAMVDAAAAIWSAVPTAAVNLSDMGNLAEDVNGSNIVAGIGVTNGIGHSVLLAPSDVVPSATTAPVGVIFDADGSVIEALWGAGASQPENCEQNGVLVWIDNMNPNATFAHGIIVLNGLCPTSPNLVAMMNYQLEQAFGRLLGLDFAQVNDGAANLNSTEPNGALAWPVMDPLDGSCGVGGGTCIPNPTMLRMDDIAALNRIYPVTAANLGNFPGSLLTAANTVSIQGTIFFRNGLGMQGVNVVARPLDANGNPLYQYTVTFVSGAYFAGNRGNPVTGWTDANGNRLDQFGSQNPALEGYFDLSGIPLPPGVTSANYQVSFEAVNPLYIYAISVGPYEIGSPAPSGTMPVVTVPGLSAGSASNLTVTIGNSASDTGTQPMGTEAEPVRLSPTGIWTSRLGRAGAGDWLLLPVRGNRIFTVVAQALNEMGAPSGAKAFPALGVWDGFDLVGTAAAGYAPAQNGIATGETWLQVATAGSEIVRLCVADQRGDGRPDYVYRGWVLYADTVSPSRLPASGGAIVIRGTGFRFGDSVMVGGVAALVTEILPNEITAMVAAAGTGQTQPANAMDVTVNDLPLFFASATIPGGLSYDSASGDALNLVAAPANQVPLNVPQAFSVVAQGANGTAAGGVTVNYSVTSGAATLGCGQTTCAVTASGDGLASLTVTATNTSIAVVTASLTDGASVQAHFYGGTPAALTELTPALYLAGGTATVQWPVQALVQSAGSPVAGQQVTWQSVAGIVAPASPVVSNAFGIASATLTAGPLAEGQTVTANACLTGTSTCVQFTAFGSRPEFAGLVAVSGTSQSLMTGATPAPVTIRVLDANGNEMAGGIVKVYEELRAWAPPCPRRGRCSQAQLLATQTLTLTTALDGSVTFAPLSLAGVASSLTGVAETGNSASLVFTVEEHL